MSTDLIRECRRAGRHDEAEQISAGFRQILDVGEPQRPSRVTLPVVRWRLSGSVNPTALFQGHDAIDLNAVPHFSTATQPFDDNPHGAPRHTDGSYLSASDARPLRARRP